MESSPSSHCPQPNEGVGYTKGKSATPPLRVKYRPRPFSCRAFLHDDKICWFWIFFVLQLQRRRWMQTTTSALIAIAPDPPLHSRNSRPASKTSPGLNPHND